jgi:hypothetical protein
MSDKFNELIELIISEETDQAKALFHDIVVEKSRSIYESLIDETEEDETEEDEELEESDFDEELGGDAAEEFINDISADEEGLALEDEGEEEEMEDRVVDLEDALDELKAEFEKMMAGEEGEEDDMDMDMEPEMDDMEMDMDAEEDEDEEDEDEEDDMEETFVREYKEKVAAPSNTSEKHSSPVAKKNPMNANGAKPTSTGRSAAETGAAKVTAKVDDAGNGNKPGAKSNLKKA